jgi:hypothetical protein
MHAPRAVSRLWTFVALVRAATRSPSALSSRRVSLRAIMAFALCWHESGPRVLPLNAAASRYGILRAFNRDDKSRFPAVAH